MVRTANRSRSSKKTGNSPSKASSSKQNVTPKNKKKSYTKRRNTSFSVNKPSSTNGTNSDNTSTSSRRKQATPLRKENLVLQPNIGHVTYKVFKEIKRLQSTTKLLIEKLSFGRLVRELFQEAMVSGRVTHVALEILQEASEDYLVKLLNDSYLCTLHRGRCTLKPSDMRLVQILRGEI